MNPLTHFKKIRILPLLSLGSIFALVTAAHAQNLYVSTQTRTSGPGLVAEARTPFLPPASAARNSSPSGPRDNTSASHSVFLSQ